MTKTTNYQNNLTTNLLTKDQLHDIINKYVLFEINELRIITNTFVWDFVNVKDLYDTLYNEFLHGFKKFQYIKKNDLFYIIEKDEYKNSL